jgi:glycine hydroxymethyltransferase
MREIADQVGAVLMVDMAHFAGLVAGKVFTGEFNPVPYAHIITSTTHKTLRGPRGGLVLCNQEFREVVDKGCPIILGGPLPHVIAAKAIAFKEAATPAFVDYAHQIVKNARSLAEGLLKRGVTITTGNTENHLIVIDVAKSFGLNGRQAEQVLRQASFTVNRNTVPFDQNGAWYTSGVRIGTPALTTLGMKEKEMDQIAEMMVTLLKGARLVPFQDESERKKAAPEVDATLLHETQLQVKKLLHQFPLYPEIDIE